MTVYGIRLSDLPDNVAISIRLVNPWNGSWLASLDVDAHDGLGEAHFTDMPGDALRFESFDQAKGFWATQSTVRPYVIPEQGAPYENRPLSICSIVVDELPE